MFQTLVWSTLFVYKAAAPIQHIFLSPGHSGIVKGAVSVTTSSLGVCFLSVCLFCVCVPERAPFWLLGKKCKVGIPGSPESAITCSLSVNITPGPDHHYYWTRQPSVELYYTVKPSVSHSSNHSSALFPQTLRLPPKDSRLQQPPTICTHLSARLP
ncbi:hypothetical protein UPYG_G00268900 [Umbra pygmaea]|uniref:Uncharacterized protein n=1 Tax=Umbra pygmaea TaxID=75934 RepID=A0ABD0WY34_UMBPY